MSAPRRHLEDDALQQGGRIAQVEHAQPELLVRHFSCITRIALAFRLDFHGRVLDQIATPVLGVNLSRRSIKAPLQIDEPQLDGTREACASAGGRQLCDEDGFVLRRHERKNIKRPAKTASRRSA